MVGRKVNQVSASCVSARQSLASLWRNVLTVSVNTSGDVDVTVLIVRGLSALMGGDGFLVSLRRTTARPAGHPRRLGLSLPSAGPASLLQGCNGLLYSRICSRTWKSVETLAALALSSRLDLWREMNKFVAGGVLTRVCCLLETSKTNVGQCGHPE